MSTLKEAIEALPKFEFKTPNKPPTPHNGWAPKRPWQSGRRDPVAQQLFTESFANTVHHDLNNEPRSSQ